MKREHVTSALEGFGSIAFTVGAFIQSVGLGLMVVGGLALLVSWRVSR